MRIFLIAVLFYSANAFLQVKPNVIPHGRNTVSVSTFAKWEPSPEEIEQGYGPVGSLIRQGPVPFFIRLTDPNKYNAAVDKYMMQEGCTRIEAMANMDAYFQDPNGWTLQKFETQKGGFAPDYVSANMDPKQIALTAVWSAGLFAGLCRIIAVNVFGA
eukprot:CAMPEP_0113933872 /NCGR_PEP_ID=MMETSP1339-20121228/1195_1 /TAXON_ID=94617 /ORGANISM="Fibrocapsa japonica" /LENGTH=157 /DNA_ID=CAMNT_0000935381 /DNA_START=139 /DNA_END=612 /DNA_ORIENTATION=+ /assembly_acc=CAM_ASM_000762